MAQAGGRCWFFIFFDQRTGLDCRVYIYGKMRIRVNFQCDI